jgi:hypothetical protein
MARPLPPTHPEPDADQMGGPADGDTDDGMDAEMSQQYGDPPPRSPAPPDQGGEDFDPTDPGQKPEHYDDFTAAAAHEAEQIQAEVPEDRRGDTMIEWRRRWIVKARKAGMSEQQANRALDDIEDSL